MEQTKGDLTIKAKNVLGKEVEVYIGPTRKENRAWKEKGKVEDCQICSCYIDAEEAKKILKIVKEKKRDSFILPPENLVLGLCLWGSPKILTPPRKNVFKKCHYIRND